MTEFDETLYQTDEERSETMSASSTAVPQLPGYAFHELLGRGSFGEVWSATHQRTEQRVAVKFLRRGFGIQASYFAAEMEKLRLVSVHPGIVSLIDADLTCETPYFVMPYLDGGSLGAFGREAAQRPPVERVVDWLRQTADALSFSHERGLLHCDLKPENLMLDEQGKIRLVDFGQSVTERDETSLGTLGFMPVEQLQPGAAPSTSWDVHALGATFYVLLGGVVPRLSPDLGSRLSKAGSVTERLEICREDMVAHPLVDLRELNPGVDEDLNAIVMNCLRRDVEKRTPSARQVLDDLERRGAMQPVLSNRPWKRSYLLWRWFQRSRAMLLGGLALWATVFALVMWLATNFEVPETTETLAAPTIAHVPEAENVFFAYRQAASRVVSVLPPGRPEFDLNGDGQRVSEEYLHLASVPLSEGPIGPRYKGAVEWLVGQNEASVAQVLSALPRSPFAFPPEVLSVPNPPYFAEAWDLAFVCLLQARIWEQAGKYDRALELQVATLLMDTRASWGALSRGHDFKLGPFPMVSAMQVLDVLDRVDLGRVSQGTLARLLEIMKAEPRADLLAILAARRDFFVARVRSLPTVDLSEPPPLSLLRGPVLGLFERSWNAHVLEMGETRSFTVIDPPGLLAVCHPIKWTANYLVRTASFLPEFHENYVYYLARVRGFEVRLAQELYRRRHGRAADELEQLVPEFLDSVPDNPMSPGRPFVMRDGGLYGFWEGAETSAPTKWAQYHAKAPWKPLGQLLPVDGAAAR